MKNRFLLIIAIPLVLSVLYACANTSSIARIHPEEVKGIPNCTECHTDSWGAMNHQAVDFYKKHGFYAGNARQACAACHQESFCLDCHAAKEEIKPGDKYGESPDRMFPHRGDYLSQHRIDAKTNPTSCVRCHGRQNNARCTTCHNK